ncbi:hypothetical protein ACP70R_030320 [Stipagrostis hirtigluma subsp. patula]
MKQQRCSCSFLAYRLLVLLMSLIVLTALLIGLPAGVQRLAMKSMGGRVGGEAPPAPTSSKSYRQAYHGRDHSTQPMLPTSPGKG